MHLLSTKRADWPTLRDLFKARDTTIGNANFRFARVPFICYLSTFAHDAAASIDNRCVIKANGV